MSGEYTAEITANLDRAEESIRAARELLQGGYFDFAASRAYYAVFYAATAALLNEGVQYKKHSGVIGTIHRDFVKTGRLSEKAGKDLNWLFELRNVGDYGATAHVPKQDAKKAIKAAESFLRNIRKILKI